MSKPQNDNGINYRQRRNRREFTGVPKRTVDFERNMQARMIARAVIHSVKMTNRKNQTALKGKNAYYIAAYLGRTVTADNMRELIAQSSATATLADGLAATGSPPVERRKVPRDRKAA